MEGVTARISMWTAKAPVSKEDLLQSVRMKEAEDSTVGTTDCRETPAIFPEIFALSLRSCVLLIDVFKSKCSNPG